MSQTTEIRLPMYFEGFIPSIFCTVTSCSLRPYGGGRPYEEECVAAAAQAAVAGAALDHTPLVRQPHLVAAARPAPLVAPPAAAAAVQSRSHYMELRYHHHHWYQSQSFLILAVPYVEGLSISEKSLHCQC
jgi:hypothetical protein